MHMTACFTPRAPVQGGGRVSTSTGRGYCTRARARRSAGAGAGPRRCVLRAVDRSGCDDSTGSGVDHCSRLLPARPATPPYIGPVLARLLVRRTSALRVTRLTSVVCLAHFRSRHIGPMADDEPQVGDWVHVHGRGVGVVQYKEKHMWDASPHIIDFNPSGGGTETLVLR